MTDSIYRSNSGHFLLLVLGVVTLFSICYAMAVSLTPNLWQLAPYRGAHAYVDAITDRLYESAAAPWRTPASRSVPVRARDIPAVVGSPVEPKAVPFSELERPTADGKTRGKPARRRSRRKTKPADETPDALTQLSSLGNMILKELQRYEQIVDRHLPRNDREVKSYRTGGRAASSPRRD